MSDETDRAKTAICQCGAGITVIDDGWEHTNPDYIDVPEHKPTPLTNQPPPKGHENFDYLQQRFQEELDAQEHLKQGQVEQRVDAYEEHVREIESLGYVPPAAPEDTLAEWIYSRQRQQNAGFETPWAELGRDDQDFWKHEARAYRRAVARDGFKDYDPELGKK